MVLSMRLTTRLVLALLCFMGVAQAEPLKVCAVVQLYQALHALQKHSPIDYSVHFATANELYAYIANAHQEPCSVVLTNDERLPISLIRSQKAQGDSLKAFTQAPLVIFSADTKLFHQHTLKTALEQHAIKSLALAAARLTPVGFAANQVVRRSELNFSYLKDKNYISDQEYQVYSMVASGNVHAGIVSKPLIVADPVSYWDIPRSWHSDIQYYVLLLNASKDNNSAHEFMRYLISNSKAQQILQEQGFAPLTPD